MTEKVNCKNCAWLVLEDDGYSNYTVEETWASCILEAHPLLPAETGYKNDPGFDIECASFHAGTPADIDVDGDKQLGEYGDPEWDRCQPYFEDELVKAVVKLKQWTRRR